LRKNQDPNRNGKAQENTPSEPKNTKKQQKTSKKL
jgi:hypothetical protein